LSVTPEELDTPSVSHLLYLSVKLDKYSRLLQALLDAGSSINLIHESIVSLLDIPHVPCVGPKVSLADGKTTLSCNSFVVLSYTIAGVAHKHTFFVSSIGAQAMILGMPWLEKVNPLIDWIAKTVEPRPVPSPSTSTLSLHPSLPPLPQPPPPRSPSRLPSSSSPPLPPPFSAPSSRPPSPSLFPRHPAPFKKPRKKSRSAGRTSTRPAKSPFQFPSPSLKSLPSRAIPKPPSSPSSSPPKKRLPRILPTKSINPKRDKLILYCVMDISQFTPPPLDAQVNSVSSANPPTSVPEEYAEFADVFEPKNAQKLPPHRPGVDHEIPLVADAKPVFGSIYNMSETELKLLKDYIDSMVAKGFIRPSKSPFGSPVLFVQKPDGSLRLCVDYRKLNEITVKNRYALPLMSELFDRLKNAKYYTRLDLADAYNQLRIAQGDEYKTAFRTRYGHFEYLVMPFGLTNAPASFQSYANDCLREFLDVFCIVYIDDVLIYSRTLEEHIAHVKKVLTRLREYGLTCKLSKCEFHATSTSFLGFIISPDGISMEPDRVAAITEWPIPTSVHDIQIFLGFANFYRRFIHGYSRVTAPMTSLLRKNQRFEWSSLAQEAFDELKRRFTTAPVLRHFDPDLSIRLHTDASSFAISGILSQLHPDSQWHPVAFFSRKCIPAECNYGIPDLEMLAIVESMRHWRHYLEGSHHPIQVLSDHKNLTTFMSTKVLNRRQARWAELLADYDFVLIPIPGKKNPADGPSRRPDYAENPLPMGSLIPPHALRLLPSTDSNLNALLCNLTGVHAGVAVESSRNQFLAAYPTDPVAQQHLPNPSSPHWSCKDGLLFYKGLLYVPESLRMNVLQEHHDAALAGHPGISRTLELVTRNYWFPGINAFVKDYVNSCYSCQQAKPPRHPRHGELASLPVPTSPWKGLSCDFITDLPVSDGMDSVLVFVDRMTKMAHFIKCLKTTDAPEFARLFVSNIVRLHGLPDSIVSDRGSIFTSHFWSTVASILKIDPRKSTAFHPQTDGQTERMNQTLETYLRISCSYNQDDWSDWLPLAEFAYNNARQESTKMTPFFANYGYNPRFISQFEVPAEHSAPAAEDFGSHLHEIHDRLVENVKAAQDSQARYYDAKHERVEFQPGDMVWLNASNISTSRPSKKLDWKRLGPYKVIKRIGLQAYQLALPPTMRHLHNVFHVSLLDPVRPTSLEPRRPPAPPALYVKDDQEYFEIEDILDSHRDESRRLKYLIKWKGFPDSENSWEPLSNIPARGLVKEFHRRNPGKPGEPRRLHFVGLLS
jgi:hypothetical protein